MAFHITTPTAKSINKLHTQVLFVPVYTPVQCEQHSFAILENLNNRRLTYFFSYYKVETNDVPNFQKAL